jgi:hypothetical protein
MTRTPAARILGVGHLNTMQSLRRRGRLYGFRRPDSDQYELQFWCGKALLWQVTSLAWEEYRQIVLYWTACQPAGAVWHRKHE